MARPRDDEQVAQCSSIAFVRSPRGDWESAFWAWNYGGDWNWIAASASVLEGDEDNAEVPWSQVPARLAINRLCTPDRELAIEQCWFPATALGDLLGIDAAHSNDRRRYRCLHRLLPYKGALAQHLQQRGESCLRPSSMGCSMT